MSDPDPAWAVTSDAMRAGRHWSSGSLGLLVLGSMLAGCSTDDHDHHVNPCPGAGGDLALPSPTFITSIPADRQGKVLARTNAGNAATVNAVVTAGRASGLRAVVSSQIELQDEPRESATGALATSNIVRTSDLRDHRLTLAISGHLAAGTYYVIATQRWTSQCDDPPSGETDGILGTVVVAREQTSR